MTNDDRQDERKSSKKWMLAGGAIVLALTVGTAAYAHHRGGGGGFGGHVFHRVLRNLDLTEEQEVMAVRLMREMREEGRVQREAHRAELEALRAQLGVEQPDATRLHAMLDEEAQARTKLGHQAIDRFLEFHATLSAEQRAELVTMLEKLEERRRQWHEE